MREIIVRAIFHHTDVPSFDTLHEVLIEGTVWTCTESKPGFCDIPDCGTVEWTFVELKGVTDAPITLKELLNGAF